jgi:small ligand-binding sensory domain FIST
MRQAPASWYMQRHKIHQIFIGIISSTLIAVLLPSSLTDADSTKELVSEVIDILQCLLLGCGGQGIVACPKVLTKCYSSA